MSREKSISRTESNHPRVSEAALQDSFSCCSSVVEKTTRTGYPVAQGGTWEGFSVPLSPSQIIVYVIWEVLSSLFSKFFQRFLRAISEDIGLDELRHTDNNK